MLRLAAQTPNYRAQKLITARVRAAGGAARRRRVTGAARLQRRCAHRIFERLVRNSSFTLFTQVDGTVKRVLLIEIDVAPKIITELHWVLLLQIAIAINYENLWCLGISQTFIEQL